LPPQINADIDKIYKWLKNNFIVNNKKKPICKNSLLQTEPWLIISYYNSIVHSILSYFRCVDNINILKKIITYQIRYSLLHTLAHKHKCSLKKILETYSKEIKALNKHKKEVSFINSVEVTNMKKEFLIKKIQDPYKSMSKTYIDLQKATISIHHCTIKICNETKKIKLHHTRKLFRNIDKFEKIIIESEAKKLSSRLSIKSSLKRKQIPLCSKHCKDLHNQIIFRIHIKDH